MMREAKMKLRAQGTQPILLTAVRPNVGEAVAYRHALERLIDAMHASVYYWVQSAWQRSGLAQDAQSPRAQLSEQMAKLAQQWQSSFDEQSALIARRFAKNSKRQHDVSFSSSLKEAGFAVSVQSLPEIDSVLEGVVVENVDLIKSIPAEYFEDVTAHIMESVEKGRAMKEVTHYLQDRYGITRRRAALIARDQNNKASALIHRVRQKQVGITEAVWVHTTASKTPREEHEGWGDEGTRYNIDEGMWSEEDEEFVWPGTPVNCGCTCLSVVPGSEEESEGDDDEVA
jgi:SPP1 gp7 family putative phage head morphogenesis protein